MVRQDVVTEDTLQQSILFMKTDGLSPGTYPLFLHNLIEGWGGVVHTGGCCCSPGNLVLSALVSAPFWVTVQSWPLPYQQENSFSCSCYFSQTSERVERSLLVFSFSIWALFCFMLIQVAWSGDPGCVLSFLPLTCRDLFCSHILNLNSIDCILLFNWDVIVSKKSVNITTYFEYAAGDGVINLL